MTLTLTAMTYQQDYYCVHERYRVREFVHNGHMSKSSRNVASSEIIGCFRSLLVLSRNPSGILSAGKWGMGGAN